MKSWKVKRDLKGYATSREYEKLYDLAKKQSVACIVNYGGTECRDIAQTIASHGEVQITARGIAYVYANNRKDFAAQCKRENVEFIVPKGFKGKVDQPKGKNYVDTVSVIVMRTGLIEKIMTFVGTPAGITEATDIFVRILEKKEIDTDQIQTAIDEQRYNEDGFELLMVHSECPGIEES